MNATLEQPSLMAPVTTEQVVAEKRTMRTGVINRVFGFVARVAFGGDVVAAVNTDIATHAALARQDNANRPGAPEGVQDYFRVDLSHLPPAVIGGRMGRDSEPQQVQPVEAPQHEAPQHQDPEQR
ncbi:MAG TPA: hypothetical protein VMR45_05380 [Patescibacteria group bacterium]|nr:hypothetical protein [Patescibacteria group bacterium]